MSEIELHRKDGAIELTLDGETGHPLMLLEALPPLEADEAVQPSSALLAALDTLGVATPSLQAAVRQAAADDEDQREVHAILSPATVAALANGLE